jgi:hypothetical protein
LAGDGSISQKALQLSQQWNQQTMCFQIRADFSGMMINPETVLLEEFGIPPDNELKDIIRIARERFEIPEWPLINVYIR